MCWDKCVFQCAAHVESFGAPLCDVGMSSTCINAVGSAGSAIGQRWQYASELGGAHLKLGSTWALDIHWLRCFHVRYQNSGEPRYH